MTRSNHDKKPHQKRCKICKTGFNPYRTVDNFCSYECAQQSKLLKAKSIQRENTTKKRQHEKRKLSQDQKTYLTQREKLRTELNSIGKAYCNRCGCSQNLDCHHIVWRSEIPRHEEKHNVRNLIFVCRECHNWYHDKKGNRNEIVEERKLYELFGDKIRNK